MGIDEPLIDSIGRLPEGHGFLGLLVLDGKPLRVADVSTHPTATGFPRVVWHVPLKRVS